ncbi:Glutaryl-CoA dehydrogenase [Mucor velutinosus]|uniref:Glutaryl-CoA dehydrogenase n=1 Tax=Mucor velutinosus TaxID=708070 RepID=A0AAN7DDY7_9FUNG|nr:Glutaryl-CoA dehydrogenase [Mucor velutinosus]
MSETMTPNSDNVDTRLVLIDQLKDFLVSAPNEQSEPIKQHHLPSGECISCVKWHDKFYISGTDIVRCLTFRFQAFGRPVENQKKFEEGVFSDLRNLKPGTDAILEEPKSAFLDLLFKNNCIRTQKKQKVFHWYSVPHDRLFLDALERDLKREKMGVEPTSKAVAHPAVSINLDTTQAMFDEFRKSVLCELNLDTIYKQEQSTESSTISDTDSAMSSLAVSSREGDLQKASSTIFGQFSLFEGSPTYKQRRRRVTQNEQTALDDNTTRSRRRSTESALATLSALPSTSSCRVTTTSRKQVAVKEEHYNHNQHHHHSAVRHFECPLPSCGKIFKRLEHMKRHLRTHTLERPFLCDLCGKRFSRSDNLAQHKKTHKRNKPSQSQLQQQHEEGKYHPDEDMEDEEAQGEENDDDSTGDDDDDDDYVDKRVRIKSGYGAIGGGRLNGQARRRINYAKSDTKPYSAAVAVNPPVSRAASASRGRVTARTRNGRHGNSSRTRSARRQAPYRHRSALDTQVLYDTEDWSAKFEDVECVKSILSPTLCQQQTQQQQQQQQTQQLVIQPTLSNSTSSANSSCHSSPTIFENSMCPPIIKLEDVDLFYDLSYQQRSLQQQQQEQLALVEEEFLPSIMTTDRKDIMEDEQYPQEWQQRIDWQQYSLPTSPTIYNYTTEDLIYDQAQAHSDMYLLPASHTHHPSAYPNASSNASSCLASPMPAFLMTPNTHSAATTVANSPIIEEDYYHPYYSDESPTMTPIDCLLQY